MAEVILKQITDFFWGAISGQAHFIGGFPELVVVLGAVIVIVASTLWLSRPVVAIATIPPLGAGATWGARFTYRRQQASRQARIWRRRFVRLFIIALLLLGIFAVALSLGLLVARSTPL